MSVSVVRACIAALVAFVVAMPATAQTPPSASKIAPNPAAASEITPAQNPLASRVQLAPALAFLQTQGVKLTSLGTDGGLAAYLGESPNGRMQVFYVTPDGDHVIAGLLFDAHGANITGIQLGEMKRRFDAAQTQIGDGKQVGGEASPIQPTASVVTKSPAPAPVTQAPPAAAQTTAPIQSAPPVPAPAPEKKSEETHRPASDAASYISPLDRGAVERSLQQTAWFDVGVKTAPVVYMVVDPQCPFCHAAWMRLRDAIFAKKLQVRVLMIAGLKGSRPLAISILARPSPGKAWLAGEGSMDGIEVAPAPAESSREYTDAANFLDKNAAFVRQFGITSTPTFMYFGKTDDRLYSSIGLPDDAERFMAALY